MKKILPFLLLGIGFLTLVAVFLFVKKDGPKDMKDGDDESAVIDVAPEDRPYISLVPSNDGHYLLLKIENIVIDAESIDYELLYQTKDNITQGVPGTIAVSGSEFEADLLLGSESSGKFRYDEGVETGSVTLRFRNDAGKLVARFTTDFHMQKGVAKLTSVDGTFTHELEKAKDNVFYVTMQTIGTKTSQKPIASDSGYSVFSSELR